MWRGTQAGHESIYLHSRLPLVSERGNSPMLRELVQMLVRVNDRERSDWISEGLAEYYAIELLRRAGGMSDERYQSLNDRFARDSKRVTTLRRSEEHTSELQSLMRISYAVFCLKKKK